MGINLVIAVTDGDWFEVLRQQPKLAEVNFWAPSAANFRAPQPAPRAARRSRLDPNGARRDDSTSNACDPNLFRLY
jgi:hypothetical protein